MPHEKDTIKISVNGNAGSGRIYVLSVIKLAMKDIGLQVLTHDEVSDIDEHSIVIESPHEKYRRDSDA